jgi:hypothetical protein
MIGVLAELERSLIVERTQAGMTEARRRGVKFGRKKKKLTPAQITKARKLIEAGERVEDVAALWNVGRTTLPGACQLVQPMVLLHTYREASKKRRGFRSSTTQRREFHRKLIDPCRALTDELHTKLHVIGIHGDRSADFVGGPITEHYGMVSHVIAKGGGAILPVEANERARRSVSAPWSPPSSLQRA